MICEKQRENLRIKPHFLGWLLEGAVNKIPIFFVAIVVLEVNC